MSSKKNEFSDYVDSLDTFIEKFEDKDEDEEFKDKDEDEGEEGFKSKTKSSPEYIPRIDIIDYLTRKAGGSSKDVSLAKQIFTSLFTLFLSLVVAHNWYSHYFITQLKPTMKTTFSIFDNNKFLEYVTMYIVQMVTSIDEYVMNIIPNALRRMANTSQYFGRRTFFYFILSASLGLTPFFLTQISTIIEYLRKEINKLIYVIIEYKKNPVGLRDYFRDLINDSFNAIFLFKGNMVLSSILGISYIIVFTSNIVGNPSKGIFANVFDIIPNSLISLVTGNIFYIIFLFFKFAMFYQPSIAFSSFIITVYFFYYSLLKTGVSSLYSLYKTNDAHMNDGRVAFKPELFGGFINNIENFLKIITNNFHEILLFFTMRHSLSSMFSFSSNFLKASFLVPGITIILKIIFNVLSKYGIGKEEMETVAQGVSEINSKVDIYDYVEKKFKQEESPEGQKQNYFTNMFDRIYDPYKTA